MNGEGGGRTYSIWSIVVVFAVLAAAGLALLLTSGGSGSSTVQVATPQTLPEGLTTTDSDVSGDDAGTGSTTEPPAVAPSGDLPDGVAEVQSEAGTTSFVFDTPAGVDPASLEAVVAPMTVRVALDGTSAVLAVGCARSSEEFLAQVVVTDGDQSVTFAAVALHRPGGPACPPEFDGRRVELDLPSPLDGRSVVVVPVGTEVPPLRPA